MPKLTLIRLCFWLCLARMVVYGEAVPKPTITSSCTPDKTSCTLTCEGDTTDAEPITYSWKVGEGAWEVIGKHLVVSKSDTGKSTNSYKYFCKLKNSAGEGEASEPVGQVFGPDLYHKVGGELVLKPDKSTVTDPIISILWKHGKYKVAEWDKDFGLDIYAPFKERSALNQATGELRISGLTKTDSGVYSVEFNGKLLDKTYKLSVIKAVPKPTITSSCNTNKTTCTLTCEGDTTNAEPVTYSWKVGEGAWEVIDKRLVFSKSDTGKSTNSYKYFCKMKNSAGEGEASEPVGDVFGPEPSEVGVVAGVVVVIFVLVATITGMLVWKKKKENPDDTMRESLSKVFCGICAKASDGNNQTTAKGNDVVQPKQEATPLMEKK